MKTPAALPRLLLVLPLACLTVAAHAQWQWIDGTGRKVFSDTAPPPGTPEKNILSRPAATRAAPPAAPVAAQPAAAVPGSAPVSGVQGGAPKEAVDPKLEARKREAEAAEAAKKKAEEERMARQRAENCERARSAKATLDSGVRIATTSPSGERSIMDDAARATEQRRVADAIRTECGPAPRPAQ
ncbi:DUF4124 domain-containing protein [Hydrogenophaga sp. R2]|uniref:DUF4124 domain-containing protein n=1 Tax=Hydrogenophaga sp. R2 TaxID=3132827 RepID=UPI003CEF8FE4